MQKLKRAIKSNPRLKPLYSKAYNLAKMLKRLSRGDAYMDWSYLVMDEIKVAYVVMQKVACTSIKASMLKMESSDSYFNVNTKIRASGYVRGKLDPAIKGDYFIFTFVRNPFERLISCYENKYHTDRAIKRPDEEHGKALKYTNYLLGYLAKDRGFLSFAKRVCNIPDMISDHHFCSQSFLIDRQGKAPQPDFIGHYERLSEEYEQIRERYGFMSLPHHNKTPKPVMWMDYYDIPTAEKVCKRYREDIERFGYQETYDKLIEYLKNR